MMKVLAALTILSVAAASTPLEVVTCAPRMSCPCGSTGGNFTVCTREEKKEDFCMRWSKCRTCQDGIDRCLECPDGMEGPLCSTKSDPLQFARRKRQYFSHPPHGMRPRRPASNPYQQQRGYCPELNSPKLGSIRCVTSNRERVCVGKCLPGYSFEGRETENEMTLTCTGSYYTPLREFPPCKSGGHCDLVVQGPGSFNCTTGMDGTRCDVFCSGRYTGRYFCYPGSEWSPYLPPCVRAKEVSEIRTCPCEHEGRCDGNGNCVCPVGRTGRYCETIVEAAVTCSDPGFVKNGFRRKPGESDLSVRHTFDEGESVVYSCEDGYALQGSALLTCQNDGSWSNPLPKCIRTTTSRDPSLTFCRDPGLDPNGSRKPRSPPGRQGFPQGSRLEYACDEGFFLDGDKSLFCLTSGKWSAPRPTCADEAEKPGRSPTYCQNPGPISNGHVTYYPPLDGRQTINFQTPRDVPEYPEGGRLEYSCDNEYVLRGSESITCQADGFWSAEQPVCRRESLGRRMIFCRDPGVDTNGSRVPLTPPNRKGFPQGTRLDYSCGQGYDLEGDRNLYCLTTGGWSSEIPRCVYQSRASALKYCPNPGPIENGRIAFYPALNNRQVVEPQTSLEGLEFLQGSRLTYSCDSGYSLDGRDTLTCEPHGYWSHQTPVCRRDPEKTSYCYSPGPVSNGKAVHVPAINERRREPVAAEDTDELEYPEGSRLLYSCDVGYSLQGTANLTCEASGDWSADPPTCITRDVWNINYCVNPGPVLNGRILYYSPAARPRTGSTNIVSEDTPEYPEGTRLEYECYDGYIAEGITALTCQSSGLWSAMPPKCTADCGRSVMGTTRRILHGNKTVAGEWPWVVGIAVTENNRSRLICGGAVLNTQTVVTAAHCLTGATRFILYFGKYHRHNNEDDELVLVRRSDKVVMHPDFNNNTLDSDIALITFKPKIRYSQRVQPVCLPSAESTTVNLAPGKKGYVTGWGDTERRLESDVLLMAHLPFVNQSACLSSFRQNVPNFNPSLTQNMFCAGYPDAQQTTCRGDSGSPLVYYDPLTERYTLEGLVSFGVEGQCGLPGRYSVFTKVYRFLPWIFRNSR